MTYLKEKPEAVCAECEWCPHGKPDRQDPPPDSWMCGTVSSNVSQGYDPVTGKEKVARSLCRVVNHDGKCKHYEARTPC